MASAVKRLCSQPWTYRCARPVCAKIPARPQWQRSFSSTLLRAQGLPPRSRGAPNVFEQDEPEWADLSDPESWQGPAKYGWEHDNTEIIEDNTVDKSELGFWAEGDEDQAPDEPYYGDDLSSLGHGQLEQHREVREYARLAAWELPLLSNLSKPFELPSKEQVLRFRYTTYLGEQHPAAHKVVAEFCPSDIPNLTPQQQAKLIKISGPRYNPSTEIVKLSCELFDSQAQNKRFLGDVVNSLIKEAKDGADTFEDVPFDFRHHKPKPRYEFPKEWLMTPERKLQLEAKRDKRSDESQKRLQQGNEYVDGTKVIDSHFSQPATFQPEPVPVNLAPRKGSR